MERIVFDQEQEIAELKERLSKYKKALSDIENEDCASDCQSRSYGIDNGPCWCHRAIAEKAMA